MLCCGKEFDWEAKAVHPPPSRIVGTLTAEWLEGADQPDPEATSMDPPTTAPQSVQRPVAVSASLKYTSKLFFFGKLEPDPSPKNSEALVGILVLLALLQFAIRLAPL